MIKLWRKEQKRGKGRKEGRKKVVPERGLFGCLCLIEQLYNAYAYTPCLPARLPVGESVYYHRHVIAMDRSDVARLTPSGQGPGEVNFLFNYTDSNLKVFSKKAYRGVSLRWRGAQACLLGRARSNLRTWGSISARAAWALRFPRPFLSDGVFLAPRLFDPSFHSFKKLSVAKYLKLYLINLMFTHSSVRFFNPSFVHSFGCLAAAVFTRVGCAVLTPALSKGARGVVVRSCLYCWRWALLRVAAILHTYRAGPFFQGTFFCYWFERYLSSVEPKSGLLRV